VDERADPERDGDGKTDDTVALQKAIDSYRVLYLPSATTLSTTL